MDRDESLRRLRELEEFIPELTELVFEGKRPVEELVMYEEFQKVHLRNS